MILLTTALTFFIAWLGSAGVALVILRRGFAAASSVFLLVLVLASLPALSGNVVPLSTLLSVSVLAWLLRVSRQWALVLTAAPFVISLWALLFIFFGSDYLAQLLEITRQGMEALKEQLLVAAADRPDAEQQQLVIEQFMSQLPALTVENLLGRLGMMQMLMTLMALLTARWWQAMLYNPGGFAQEFHQLRLGRSHVLILVAGIVILSNLQSYQQWAWFFAMPVAVVGVGLVHGLVAIRKMGAHWLVFFYILLATFAPLVPLLMMVVIADTALDFRARLAKR